MGEKVRQFEQLLAINSATLLLIAGLLLAVFAGFTISTTVGLFVSAGACILLALILFLPGKGGE